MIIAPYFTIQTLDENANNAAEPIRKPIRKQLSSERLFDRRGSLKSNQRQPECVT